MQRLRSPLLLVLCSLLASLTLRAADEAGSIAFQPAPGALPMVENGRAIPIWIDSVDDAAVQRAANDFRADIERVSGKTPAIASGENAPGQVCIIVGTLGGSSPIDRMAEAGKIDVSDVRGRWEAFLIDVVEKPLPGVDRALVIAGSDRRGTVYGLYTLSEQMGVSPWYWWADVPVQPQAAIYALKQRVVDAPLVQYRGIFLNDEAPALSNWSREKFGGFNSQFYAKVFELILRLRGNYLWPAMWGNAFYDDDPRSGALAHEYGIVMGTSHHEPLTRAQAEWHRYGKGPWDYKRNGEVLREFWRGALQERKDFDTILTIGMRGDGDEAMSEDTNVALLEKIVDEQRQIIEEVTGKSAEEVPQLWALYKEVQSYYEHGMRVPDDVTLLWADDNWGNIRRLPTPAERQRPGGAGVYYHFDYVGGPRNYKWMNITPIRKVWEQMHLAWQYEANRIWIVNVGDLKPMEFPISFFLDYAWDPAAIEYDELDAWSAQWAAKQFGTRHAQEIADLINGYSKLNRRRTAEMMEPTTFSHVNYDEAERVLAEWRDLVNRAEAVARDLPKDAQSAFFQLVLYPVKASATVQELYIEAGRNRLYAYQRRTETNESADRVNELFQLDGELARQYHSINGGKWNHFMDQVNLGYDTWQEPPIDVMPAVSRVRPADGPLPAAALEGQVVGWPYISAPRPVLPQLDVFSRGSRWIEVFNRGTQPFDVAVETSEPWLKVSTSGGQVDESMRIEVSADWDAVPLDAKSATVFLGNRQMGLRMPVEVPILNPSSLRPQDVRGFVEVDGHVAIDAPHFSRAVASDPMHWKVLEDFGRTMGGVTLFPVTAPDVQPGGDSPRLEFDVHFFSQGTAKIEFYLAPSLDFQSGEGLRFAASLDDGAPEQFKIGTVPNENPWYNVVGENIRKIGMTVEIPEPGLHTLKFWYVTPGVVLERIVVDTGGLRPSYLGPQESPRAAE